MLGALRQRMGVNNCMIGRNGRGGSQRADLLPLAGLDLRGNVGAAPTVQGPQPLVVSSQGSFREKNPGPRGSGPRRGRPDSRWEKIYGEWNHYHRQARRVDQHGCVRQAAGDAPRKAHWARRDAGPDGHGGAACVCGAGHPGGGVCRRGREGVRGRAAAGTGDGHPGHHGDGTGGASRRGDAGGSWRRFWRGSGGTSCKSRPCTRP